MASSQVPLPASYGTHTPGRRTTRTVRLPKLLTPSKFSTSVGQARREPRVYCSLTTRSGLRYIHHSHIPRSIPVSHFILLGLCADPFGRLAMHHLQQRCSSNSAPSFSLHLHYHLRHVRFWTCGPSQLCSLKQIIPDDGLDHFSYFISSCAPLQTLTLLCNLPTCHPSTSPNRLPTNSARTRFDACRSLQTLTVVTNSSHRHTYIL